MNNDYQGYFADCYILTDIRKEKDLIDFLNYFIPHNEISTDEFEVPQFEQETTQTFDNSSKLIEFLIDTPTEPYCLHYRNLENSDIKGATCYFTKDGGLIFGLSTETKYPNTNIEDMAF